MLLFYIGWIKARDVCTGYDCWILLECSFILAQVIFVLVLFSFIQALRLAVVSPLNSYFHYWCRNIHVQLHGTVYLWQIGCIADCDFPFLDPLNQCLKFAKKSCPSPGQVTSESYLPCIKVTCPEITVISRQRIYAGS